MDAVTRPAQQWVCLWDSINQQHFAKVKVGIATSVKGRTEIKAIKECFHYWATGKRK